MIKRVQRISIAVRDLPAALAFYRDALGLAVTAEMSLPGNDLQLVRLDAGGTAIELLQPRGTSGAVAEFIARHGEGPYHIAFEVDDLEGELRTLLARGAELIDRTPRPGPSGRIAFVHPRSTGGALVELNESGLAPDVPGLGSGGVE